MRIMLKGMPIQMLVIMTGIIAMPWSVSHSMFSGTIPRPVRMLLTTPTLVENMNLNIRAVTVIGIIQGIIRIPRTGRAMENFRLKKSASAKPIRNWKTRQLTVKTNVLATDLKKTSS